MPAAGQVLYNPDASGSGPPRLVFFSAHWHIGKMGGNSDIPWVAEMLKASSYRGWNLRVGIQTTKDQDWAQLLNYPRYGLGFGAYQYHEALVEEMLGQPKALYVFGSFPLISGSALKIGPDLAAGVVFGLNTYDALKNPNNDLIGSKLLVYFDLAFSGQLKLGRTLDLTASIDLVHFSNGRMRTPNKGVNMIGFKLGAVHYFGSREQALQYGAASFTAEDAIPQSSSPIFTDRQDFFLNLSLAAGVNSTTRGEILERRSDFIGPYYMISSFIAEGAWKYGGIGAASLGLNFHYDASLGEAYPATGGTFFQKCTFGLALGHELFIHRIGLIAQIGVYPFSGAVKRQERGSCYLRTDARWRFSDRWWVYAALKTMNRPVADFVEWGIGVSLYRKQAQDLAFNEKPR